MLASVHSAQFYMQNDSLLEMVSRFLKTGIASQTACIVIATRDHREGIAQRLQEHGFDLERAFEDGIYIALDAETTLSHILVNGSPDPERFVHTIEPLLKRVTPGSVRIFGEMTTLLWMQGKREEAIPLEGTLEYIAQPHVFHKTPLSVSITEFYRGPRQPSIPPSVPPTCPRHSC